MSILDVEATVDELMDEDSKSWKMDILYSIFRREEADYINRIPISLRGMGDKVIWGFAEKGLFKVKSAYFADFDRKNQMVGQPSVSSPNVKLWRKVWKLDCTRKVKQLIWKHLIIFYLQRKTV